MVCSPCLAKLFVFMGQVYPFVDIEFCAQGGKAALEPEDPIVVAITTAQDQSLLALLLRPANDIIDHSVSGTNLLETLVSPSKVRIYVYIVMQV